MKTVIEGKTYWKDAKGNLTPEELVKDIDKERDALVQEWVEKAKALNAEMSRFKGGIFG
ncbi:DUF3164 family protein, partial [Histophilus somni]